jgi:quercetin dioxygenase-like cupin family protein
MTGGSGVIIRRPSVAESLRILLGEADCDGALGVVEMALSPGVSGPPLHLHPTHAEAFYVLAGQLSLQVGEEVVTGGPGTWACAPKDVAHTLGNFGTEEGRLLCMFAPGGFERRFERMLAKQHGDAVLAELSEAERATRLIGPPLVSPAQPLDQMRPSSAVVPHDAGRGRIRRRTGPFGTVSGRGVDGGSVSWSVRPANGRAISIESGKAIDDGTPTWFRVKVAQDVGPSSSSPTSLLKHFGHAASH